MLVSYTFTYVPCVEVVSAIRPLISHISRDTWMAISSHRLHKDSRALQVFATPYKAFLLHSVGAGHFSGLRTENDLIYTYYNSQFIWIINKSKA